MISFFVFKYLVEILTELEVIKNMNLKMENLVDN